MSASLDLFSTSQTSTLVSSPKGKVADRKIYDECINNAPFFAYQVNAKTWGIVQGCCNNWNCPRCGQQRAREEYGRIVVGAREIAKDNKMYLMTITCKGKEMSYEDAEQGYLGWTNRLLTRLRTQAKRAGQKWYYASVTERQKRAHPHSHYITTYCPGDAIVVEENAKKFFYTSGESFRVKHSTLQTQTLERACTECGLGCQYDISELQSVEAGSRYAAKYLFKESVFNTVWPKGWRRVRYSQSWPKWQKKESTAFILLTSFDWYRLAKEALIVKTSDDYARNTAIAKLKGSDVIIH